MNDKLLATVRFYFAQCVFMNSAHYKAYSRFDNRQNLYRKITNWISGLTLVVIVLHIICLQHEYSKTLAIISSCGMVLTGASLMFTMFSKEDIGEIKSQHKNSAEKYKSLRDGYMLLIEEIMNNGSDEKTLRSKGEEFQKSYSAIGKYAPSTTYEDFQGAQNGLGLGNNTDEEFTWSDEEIDRFLPSSLRISVKS